MCFPRAFLAGPRLCFLAASRARWLPPSERFLLSPAKLAVSPPTPVQITIVQAPACRLAASVALHAPRFADRAATSQRDAVPTPKRQPPSTRHRSDGRSARVIKLQIGRAHV